MGVPVQVLFVCTHFLSQQAMEPCPSWSARKLVPHCLIWMPYRVGCQRCLICGFPRTSYFWEGYLTTIAIMRYRLSIVFSNPTRTTVNTAFCMENENDPPTTSRNSSPSHTAHDCTRIREEPRRDPRYLAHWSPSDRKLRSCILQQSKNMDSDEVSTIDLDQWALIFFHIWLSVTGVFTNSKSATLHRLLFLLCDIYNWSDYFLTAGHSGSGVTRLSLSQWTWRQSDYILSIGRTFRVLLPTPSQPSHPVTTSLFPSVSLRKTPIFVRHGAPSKRAKAVAPKRKRYVRVNKGLLEAQVTFNNRYII